MREISLHRSSSERKLGKEKKRERVEKSRSEYFDNPGPGKIMIIALSPSLFHISRPDNQANIYHRRREG